MDFDWRTFLCIRDDPSNDNSFTCEQFMTMREAQKAYFARTMKDEAVTLGCSYTQLSFSKKVDHLVLTFNLQRSLKIPTKPRVSIVYPAVIYPPQEEKK